MSIRELRPQDSSDIPFYEERVDMACALRWTARLGLHEAVANHFSLAVSDNGNRFLMNPNQKHFASIKATDLLLLDANDRDTLSLPEAPDLTAWGLHGSIHRRCPQARCVMHVHSIYATVLACLADSNMPPIDQNTATFYNRYVIDEDYGGLAFEDEGKRCAQMLSNPRIKIMIMGNHGVLIIGDSVADTFNRLYYFERAAETYVKALWTQQPLRVLSPEIAEKTARELEQYPDQAVSHFNELKNILDKEDPSFRD